MEPTLRFYVRSSLFFYSDNDQAFNSFPSDLAGLICMKVSFCGKFYIKIDLYESLGLKNLEGFVDNISMPKFYHLNQRSWHHKLLLPSKTIAIFSAVKATVD